MSHELYLFSTGLSFPPQQMLLSRISDYRCHRLGVSTTSNPRLLRRWIRCSSIVHRAVLDWLTSKANVSICQFYTFNRQCRNSRALSKYSKYVIPPSIAPVICFPLKMFDVSQTVYICFLDGVLPIYEELSLQLEAVLMRKLRIYQVGNPTISTMICLRKWICDRILNHPYSKLNLLCFKPYSAFYEKNIPLL